MGEKKTEPMKKKRSLRGLFENNQFNVVLSIIIAVIAWLITRTLMRQLGVASKITPNRTLLLQLKEAGRQAMDRFLSDHWDCIGVRSSVDLRGTFS